MKPYDNCEYEHERVAFSELEKLFPATDDVELYPNFELFDESKKTYLECDLVVVSKRHFAVVELKHWRGDISVNPNLWYRNGRAESDPHRSNNRKCKILKSTIEKNLPATQRIPFVHSIVVLTNSNGDVSGADTVNALFKKEMMPAQITFDGVYDLSEYLKKRAKLATSRSLSDSDFSRVKAYFDKVFEPVETKYSDQIPGFSIIDELEHTDSYSSYLAEKIPSLGNMHYRLRVFGVLSDDPIEKAKQVRSLKELESLAKHDNIHHAYQASNEKKLVVEVTEWLGFDTLEQRIGQVGQMLWEHASVIALGVAKALKHIHHSDQMLVHRNVSPKSILLNSDDTPQLTDFDLVYDPNEDHSVFVSPSKEYLPYLAPEIHMGNADPKSDVYSWGVTLFTMLAGEPPKKRDGGSMPEGLTSQHLEKLPAEVPESLRSILVDSMKFHAGERPESAEVVDLLEELLSVNSPSKEESNIKSSNTWVLCDLLAEGSTSEVYVGDSLGERAVLKLYKPDVTRDRCLHERDILLEVDAPGVPKYKRFFQWEDGRWCLALEYVEGDRLRDMILNEVKPSFEDFSSVTIQLLETLSSMHPDDNNERIGVIHNDINPNNILYNCESGHVGLIDFGAASVPGPVTYRGTRGYIAPDLLDAGEIDASPSGDIYGLGITLWEWLSGNRPKEKYSPDDFQLKGCSNLQKCRLYDWFSKCLGGETERFESAELALIHFHEVLVEDVPVLEVEPAKGNDEEHVKVAIELEEATECNSSSFVDYLNSIHNVTANNAHALAEAQSVNPYFTDIYEPFGLVLDVCDYLTRSEPVVVVLTGHAGDGKSTIALDVLKKLKGIPDNKELDNPPAEEETVDLGDGRFVKIVKDMSELSAKIRLNTLKNSLDANDGEFVSWLIVSNTGPLLSTFSNLKDDESEQLKVEDEILGVLSQPIEESISSENHCLHGFPKPVLLVNLAKLNNVDIASRILGKIVGHSSWENCTSCLANACCHISLNISALREGGESSLERVRWIYTRLTSYGQRMTLRQMSSHLAYSLTAGFGCEKIKQLQRSFTTVTEQNNYLASNVFSDVFFGWTDAKLSPAIASLYCVRLLKTHHFGAHSTPNIERSILDNNFNNWAKLPSSVKPTASHLSGKSSKPGNVDTRQSLRRLIYMFADINKETGTASSNYCNYFLKSSRLVELESWAEEGAIIASRAQKRNLLNSTLAVLLEEYSGFSIGQYGEINKLYVTLKRSDRNVHQPSQLVLAEFPFDDFDLVFDKKKGIPKLIHKKHDESKGLEMSLPLLDYITSRGAGDLDCGLDPIYTNQIEHFRSQLLLIKQAEDGDSHGIITLMKSGIEGEVKTYSYEISDDDMCLEGM